MKTTLVVSLEEDVAEYLDRQGQVDPSAWINKVLRDDIQRCREERHHNPMSESKAILNAEPSASKVPKKPSAVRELEVLSDLDTPAAD